MGLISLHQTETESDNEKCVYVFILIQELGHFENDSYTRTKSFIRCNVTYHNTVNPDWLSVREGLDLALMSIDSTKKAHWDHQFSCFTGFSIEMSVFAVFANKLL